MRARISAEADTMIALFGDGAYYEARNYVFAARESGRDDSYWASVTGEISRRTRRDWVDTATRYLIDDARMQVRSGQRRGTPAVKAIKRPGLDVEKVEAAFRRAAHTAVHGTREQRSGRFISTTLVSTKYDAVSRNLEVRFVNRRACIYSNVPSTVYEGLLGAESPTAFLTAFIHNHYSCREL
jgi:KTSC domain